MTTTTMIGMTTGNDSFSQQESNFAMGLVDAICCFLGMSTVFLGVWIDGISIFFAMLFVISLFMGLASFVRFSRERDIADDTVGEPWRTR